MSAHGQDLVAELDANGSSWALAADLLAGDQVPPSVGWPLFEMTLQNGKAPVILRGILRENRAWCRVLEFAEEFGNSLREKPAATA